MSLPVFVKQFSLYLRDNGRKESTIKMYEHDLKQFFLWLQEYKPGFDGEIWGDLTRYDYNQYFDSLKKKNLSDANLRRVASHLNGLLRYYRLSDRVGTLKGTDSKQRALTDLDFISSEDAALLLSSIPTKKGLTDTQLQIYPYISKRNLGMVTLMINYGLTIEEVVKLTAKDFNFGQNTLTIETSKNKRTILLEIDDKKLLYDYLKDIPDLFRPKDYTDDPFFISFRTKKLSYWFDYSMNRSKGMSLIGAKQMVEKEIKRAGLRNGISSTHFRNSCILQKIKSGWGNQMLIEYFGLSSRHALYRYKKYLNQREGN